jgi:hypothetical protein
VFELLIQGRMISILIAVFKLTRLNRVMTKLNDSKFVSRPTMLTVRPGRVWVVLAQSSRPMLERAINPRSFSPVVPVNGILAVKDSSTRRSGKVKFVGESIVQ